MSISGIKAGSQLSEHRPHIRALLLPSRHRDLWLLRPPFVADAEIGRKHQVQRWMLCPIGCQLFDLEERHPVNYGVTISTDGSEETIDFSPATTVSEVRRASGLGLALPAPGLFPGAGASPMAPPPG